jgi:flagellar hook-length control protein FliK
VPEKPAPDRPAAAEKPAPHNDVRAPQPPVPVNDKPVVSELAARSAQQQAQSLPAAAIPQIASEFAAKIKRGATRFEIRLDPPELGRIDVRIDVDKDGRVTSRLMVEKTETLDLLKADQRALERALHDAGFKSDQNTLSFSLRDERGGQAKFDEQRQLNQQSETAAPEEDPVRQVAENAYRASLRGPGGFDLRV